MVVIEHNLDVDQDRRPRDRPRARRPAPAGGRVVAAGHAGGGGALRGEPHRPLPAARSLRARAARDARRRDDPLLAWRSRVPHPRAARPTWSAIPWAPCRARPRDRLAGVRATPGPTRGVRAWAEGWWAHAASPWATRWAASSAPPPARVVMHQNVSVCQSLILSCFDLSGAAQQDRLRGPELPLGDVRVRGAPRPGRARRAPCPATTA